MLGARSVPRKCGEVRPGSVAFVFGEQVLRILPIEFLEAGVASDLGQDRSGSDGNRTSIAVDDGAVGDRKLLRLSAPRERHGVCEDEIGRWREAPEGANHRLARSLIHIQRIHICSLQSDNLEDDGVLANFRSQADAFFGRELFRIVQAWDGASGVEDDRSGIHRPQQGTAAGFVTAGD